jgi:hypothetical protein
MIDITGRWYVKHSQQWLTQQGEAHGPSFVVCALPAQTGQDALRDYDLFCETISIAREKEDAMTLERLFRFAHGLRNVDVSMHHYLCAKWT